MTTRKRKGTSNVDDQDDSPETESVEQVSESDAEVDEVVDETEISLPHRDLRVSKPLMTGTDVRKAQELLRTQGFANVPVDGTYSVKTATRVRLFQERVGLPVTGVLDSQTLKALED